MEPLNGILITFFILAPFLLIAAMIIVKVGKRQERDEREYDRLYVTIDSLIDSDAFYRKHKDIRLMLDILKGLGHKNTEKTMVIYCKYWMKLQEMEQPVNQI